MISYAWFQVEKFADVDYSSFTEYKQLQYPITYGHEIHLHR